MPATGPPAEETLLTRVTQWITGFFTPVPVESPLEVSAPPDDQMEDRNDIAGLDAEREPGPSPQVLPLAPLADPPAPAFAAVAPPADPPTLAFAPAPSLAHIPYDPAFAPAVPPAYPIAYSFEYAPAFLYAYSPASPDYALAVSYAPSSPFSPAYASAFPYAHLHAFSSNAPVFNYTGLAEPYDAPDDTHAASDFRKVDPGYPYATVDPDTAFRTEIDEAIDLLRSLEQLVWPEESDSVSSALAFPSADPHAAPASTDSTLHAQLRCRIDGLFAYHQYLWPVRDEPDSSSSEYEDEDYDDSSTEEEQVVPSSSGPSCSRRRPRESTTVMDEAIHLLCVLERLVWPEEGSDSSSSAPALPSADHHTGLASADSALRMELHSCINHLLACHRDLWPVGDESDSGYSEYDDEDYDDSSTEEEQVVLSSYGHSYSRRRPREESDDEEEMAVRKRRRWSEEEEDDSDDSD